MKPSFCIIMWYRIYSFVKRDIYIQVIFSTHCCKKLMVVPSEMCFDSRECELYGVEIRRVGREEFAAHAPISKYITKEIPDEMVWKAYRSRIISWMSSDLWIWQLSITITEFGPGNGFMCSKSPSMKCAKVSFVNEPSTISRARIPSSESAGKMEYLIHIILMLENWWRRDWQTVTFFLGQRMTFEQLDSPLGHRHNLFPYTCQLRTLINKHKLLRGIHDSHPKCKCGSFFNVSLHYNMCNLVKA